MEENKEKESEEKEKGVEEGKKDDHEEWKKKNCIWRKGEKWEWRRIGGRRRSGSGGG